MHIGPAEPPEHAAALRMLFAHLPPAEVSRRADAALSLFESAAEPRPQLLVARKGPAIVGAVLAQALVGATGVLWPPVGPSAAIEDDLLEYALAWLHAGGAKLVQAILAPEDMRLGEALLRNGFRNPTQLCYLRHGLATVPEASPRGLFRTYCPAIADEFHATLVRSYVGTLDFPEVSGRRPLEEVLRGYQSTGYDPDNWWLLSDGGNAIGVLMLANLDGERAFDLAYVGVTLAARRSGWGRVLVRKAIRDAKLSGGGELTVCVDARNIPARNLYEAHGFVLFDRREVFLAPAET
jgi:ribosomal protein S18 acetylase RimI-like enzyme